MFGKAFKRLICGLLSACFLLCTGCNSGEYYYEREHEEDRVTTHHSFNSISTFEALHNTLFNIIDSGTTGDKVRIENYDGNLDTDLQMIRNELLFEDPFGAFAVSSIDYNRESVLSYQEVTVNVQYRLTISEMRSVLDILTPEELEKRLTSMYVFYSERRAFSISPELIESPELFEEEMKKCWLQNAAYAVGLDCYECNYFPSEDDPRIVEIENTYLYDNITLKHQTMKINEHVARICASFTGETEKEKLDFIYDYLKNNVAYDRDAMRVVVETNAKQPKSSIYTAYGALVEGKAAQSGIALAAKVLCDGLNISATLVSGTVDSQPYLWLYVSCDGSRVHFDPTCQVVYGKWNADTSILHNPKEIQYVFSPEAAPARFTWNQDIYDLRK